MKIAKCPRCGDPSAPGRDLLCLNCREFIQTTWPNRVTPREQAEPWMLKMADSNIRKATAEWKMLVDQVVAHYDEHPGDDNCPAWCVGSVAVTAVQHYPEHSVRMLLMAALNWVGAEIHRNNIGEA